MVLDTKRMNQSREELPRFSLPYPRFFLFGLFRVGQYLRVDSLMPLLLQLVHDDELIINPISGEVLAQFALSLSLCPSISSKVKAKKRLTRLIEKIVNLDYRLAAVNQRERSIVSFLAFSQNEREKGNEVSILIQYYFSRLNYSHSFLLKITSLRSDLFQRVI